MKYSHLLFFVFLFSCSAQNKIVESISTAIPTKTTMTFVNRIDSAQLMRDLKYLSADELGGRETESAGSEMARDYILNRFEKLGLEKLDIGRIQDFTFKEAEKIGKVKIY